MSLKYSRIARPFVILSRALCGEGPMQFCLKAPTAYAVANTGTSGALALPDACSR
jgi:hypothetical protein